MSFYGLSCHFPSFWNNILIIKLFQMIQQISELAFRNDVTAHGRQRAITVFCRLKRTVQHNFIWTLMHCTYLVFISMYYDGCNLDKSVFPVHYLAGFLMHNSSHKCRQKNWQKPLTWLLTVHLGHSCLNARRSCLRAKPQRIGLLHQSHCPGERQLPSTNTWSI